MPQLLRLASYVEASSARMYRVGTYAGDVLRRAAGTLAPGLRTDALTGGYLSWDGQLGYDARLVVGIARTAVYGTEAPAVAALGRQDEALGEPVAPNVDTIGAELVWGLRHEGLLDIDDLLVRRSRVGLVPTDRSAALTMAEAIFANHATGV